MFVCVNINMTSFIRYGCLFQKVLGVWVTDTGKDSEYEYDQFLQYSIWDAAIKERCVSKDFIAFKSLPPCKYIGNLLVSGSWAWL